MALVPGAAIDAKAHQAVNVHSQLAFSHRRRRQAGESDHLHAEPHDVADPFVGHARGAAKSIHEAQQVVVGTAKVGGHDDCVSLSSGCHNLRRQ